MWRCALQQAAQKYETTKNIATITVVSELECRATTLSLSLSRDLDALAAGAVLYTPALLVGHAFVAEGVGWGGSRTDNLLEI